MKPYGEPALAHGPHFRAALLWTLGYVPSCKYLVFGVCEQVVLPSLTIPPWHDSHHHNHNSGI